MPLTIEEYLKKHLTMKVSILTMSIDKNLDKLRRLKAEESREPLLKEINFQLRELASDNPVTIYVDIPKGKRAHGRVEIDRSTGDKFFVRNLVFDKDFMHNYKAWSLNPQAYADLKKMNIKKLIYNDNQNKKCYALSFSLLVEYYEGGKRDNRNRVVAFSRVHKGGETIYIRQEAWEQFDKI
jgi:hypothetical protein